LRVKRFEALEIRMKKGYERIRVVREMELE
jgi:hypothetical protein